MEKPLYGMTAELYRAVVAVVDDRLAAIRVLREDFDRLEKAVEALAEAQRRTEERVEALAEAQRRTEERVEALAEAQRRTEERVGRLEAAVEALAEAQRRTEERVGRLEAAVEALAEAQRRTEERVARLQDDMGAVKGRLLEMDYREKAPAYLGRQMRQVRVRSPVDLLDELEACLSPEEVDEVWRLDLLVEGVLPEKGEVWLAMEISFVVDRHDVERALLRAGLLRRLGRPVLPAVAGEAVTEGGAELARTAGVVLLEDGRGRFWKEAIENALPQ